MPRRHVVLVGLPGSGKTTAGRLAAGTLGAPFADLDDLVAARAVKSVERIFAEDGERVFRALEREEGAALLAGEPAVVATGGGFAEDPASVAAARAAGETVYLRVSPDVAARRLGGPAGRPLLGGGHERALRDLLERREPLYLSCSHTIDTDGRTPSEVGAAIAALARRLAGW